MSGFRKTRPEDPWFDDYLGRLEARYGAEGAEEVLKIDRHNALFYPAMSVHATFMQLRVIRPLSVDLTRVDVWFLRMIGAPEAMNQRTIAFANTIHSPSSLVKVDDLEAYERVQNGLLDDFGAVGQPASALHAR